MLASSRYPGRPATILVTQALTAMEEAMTPVNAGRWQVAGVIRWRGLIEWEKQAAEDAGILTPLRIAGGADAARHTGWQALAGQIIEALRKRRRHAERESARLAVLASRHQRNREILLAQENPSPEVLERARKLQQRAATAGGYSAACDLWAAAAREAVTCGVRLTRKAEQVHEPIGRAIAKAGPGWTAEDKTWLTAGR